MNSIKPEDRFQVRKENARKWFVIDTEAVGDADVDGPFKTRHLAEESAANLTADNTPVEDDEPTVDPERQARVTALADRIEAAVAEANATNGLVEVEVNLDKTPEPESVDPATMTKAERMQAALDEHRAVKAWRTTVPRVDGEPATPVLDWMSDPANATKATAPKAERKTIEHTPEQTAQITDIITTGRTVGQSWATIAKAIEAEGIPTARGGKWYDTTASDLAKKLGITVTPQLADAG